MSRPISPSLLSAATSLSGRPVVTLGIREAQTRWEVHSRGPASTRASDATALGAKLHRVLLDGSLVRHAALASPEDPSTWPGAWRTIATDADGDADIALAAPEGAKLSVFYRNLGGYICRTDSSDGGETWSAPTDCCAWDYTPTRVASAGKVCAWSRPGEIRIAITRDDLGNPAWLPAGLYEGAGEFAQCQGLALCQDYLDQGLYYLIAALDGALYAAQFDEPARLFGPTYRIVPSGTVGVSSTSQVRDPSAISSEGALYVSFVDRTGSGDLVHWQQTVILRATDFPHFARVAILDMGQATPARAALAAQGQEIYAAHENNSCRTVPRHEDVLGLRPLAYHLHAEGGGSSLSVTLSNARRAADALGEVIRPWTQLVLSRGYLTPSGEEQVSLAPHYVTAARWEREALTLEGTDGWGLLERLHPPDLATWEQLSLRTLLAQVCGLAGLRCADAAEEALSWIMPGFRLSPEDTVAGAVRTLLAMAGAVAYFDQAGTLQVRVLEEHNHPTLALGAAGEITGMQRNMLAERANAFRLDGEGLIAASAPGEGTMSGIVLYESTADHRITQDTMANRYLGHLAKLAQMAKRTVEISLPLRPEVELWDMAEFEGGRGRVTAIDEDYDPRRGLYRTRLTLALER